MSGPKHLWSGDWERESARAAQQPAHTPLPESGTGPAQPELEPAAQRPRWNRQQLAVALGSGIAAAAVTIGLVLTLGGGSNTPAAKRLASSGAGRTHGVPQLQSVTPPRSQNPQSQNQTPPACQQNPGSCTPSSSTNVTGPTADWLGMQIVTSPDGVVISTVTLNSPADDVGLNPGDQITAIDGHAITRVSQLKADTAHLRLGSEVTIQVQRASVMVQLASLPMTERPTIHP
jgi:membrane-associated protease RseP (regulator of RpoE activity)